METFNQSIYLPLFPSSKLVVKRKVKGRGLGTLYYHLEVFLFDCGSPFHKWTSELPENGCLGRRSKDVTEPQRYKVKTLSLSLLFYSK